MLFRFDLNFLVLNRSSAEMCVIRTTRCRTRKSGKTTTSNAVSLSSLFCGVLSRTRSNEMELAKRTRSQTRKRLYERQRSIRNYGKKKKIDFFFALEIRCLCVSALETSRTHVCVWERLCAVKSQKIEKDGVSGGEKEQTTITTKILYALAVLCLIFCCCWVFCGRENARVLSFIRIFLAHSIPTEPNRLYMYFLFGFGSQINWWMPTLDDLDSIWMWLCVYGMAHASLFNNF